MLSFSTTKNFISNLVIILCYSLLLATPQTAHATEVTEIISTSPSWESFTNPDGTGLYHEILKETFSLYGINVRHIYSKSGRSEELIRKEEADVMTCDDKAAPPLILSRYPMYVNDFYVFFKKSRIGEWNGNDSLKGKELLSQPTYYDEDNFNVPVTIKDIQTGPQALAMILLDRSDFYVDDMALIEQSLKENTIPFNRDEFEIKKVGRRSYHPLFNSSEKGKKIMRMYDEGVLRLHSSGKLKAIYEKWGHLYPDFDRY